MVYFVVTYQEKWYVAITSVEPFEAFVCDRVDGIPQRFNLFAHLDHVGIEILNLSWQPSQRNEACRLMGFTFTKMPFSNNCYLITTGPQMFCHI